jgi:hypothetical protein
MACVHMLPAGRPHPASEHVDVAHWVGDEQGWPFSRLHAPAAHAHFAPQPPCVSSQRPGSCVSVAKGVHLLLLLHFSQRAQSASTTQSTHDPLAVQKPGLPFVMFVQAVSAGASAVPHTFAVQAATLQAWRPTAQSLGISHSMEQLPLPSQSLSPRGPAHAVSLGAFAIWHWPVAI